MTVQKRLRAAAGFTLIEVLVTIVVAGILMSIAMPRFWALLPAIRLSSAARQVATDLQLARMRAISQHNNVTVTFTDSSSYNFGTDSRNLSLLYPGTTITAEAPLVFNSAGTVNNMNITLSNNGVTKTVQVTPIGRVKIS